MTGKEISKQQVQIMAVFIAEPQSWHSSPAVALKAEVSGSTVRHILLTLFTLEMLQRSDLFGGYRYRLSPTAKEQPYYKRINEAAALLKT